MQKEKIGLFSNAKTAFVVLIAGLLLSFGIAFAQSPEKAYAADNNPTVEIKVKDYGTITVELDRSAAPLTVDNFVKLAKSGFYTNTTFHRVMSGFMIQGGGYKTNGSYAQADNIKGEFVANGVWNPISHKRGVISMARATDYNSASSQFFIMHQDNTSLDYLYAAFGHVTKGMDVVDKIAAAPVGPNPSNPTEMSDPKSQIVIESVKVVDTSTPAAVTGSWKKSGGKWWYSYSNGTYAKGLTTIGSAMYYFDSKGWMKTGWQHATGNSDWYYFNKSGVMKTGWVKSGGKWYYLNSEGIMQKGKITLSGKTYFLNNSGSMRTGWVQQSDGWYYTNGSGVAQTGWKKVGGKWYYLNSAGLMQTGWQTIGNAKYYFNGSGVMQTGWKNLGGKYYYFNKSGAMQTNKWISGKYWVGSDGVMATNSWVDGDRYYVDGNGKYVKNAKKSATASTTTASNTAATSRIVYAAGADVYHTKASCPNAARINNPISLSSVDEAKALGLRLCGNCAK